MRARFSDRGYGICIGTGWQSGGVQSSTNEGNIDPVDSDTVWRLLRTYGNRWKDDDFNVVFVDGFTNGKHGALLWASELVGDTTNTYKLIVLTKRDYNSGNHHDLETLAQVFAHEAGHGCGLGHTGSSPSTKSLMSAIWSDWTLRTDVPETEDPPYDLSKDSNRNQLYRYRNWASFNDQWNSWN